MMDETEVKQVLRSVLNSSKKSLTLDELQKEFRAIEGETIPYGILGYKNIHSFLKCLSDVVHIEGHGRQARYSAVLTEASKHVHDLVQRTKGPGGRGKGRRSGRSFRSTSFSKNVEPPPMMMDDGDCKDDWNSVPQFGNPVPAEYYDTPPSNAGKDENSSPPSTVGSSNSVIIVTAPHHIAMYENKKSKKPALDLLLKNVKISQPTTKTLEKRTEDDDWNPPVVPGKVAYQLYKTESVAADENTKEPTDHEKEIIYGCPSNCVENASQIRADDGFEAFCQADFIQIKITELYSPYKFWFTLHRNVEKIQSLRTDLNEFYNQIDADDYMFNPEPGNACAVRCRGIWYRGEVASDRKDDQGRMTVYLFDYGTVIKANPCFIKALITRFSRLPRQAIRGRLASCKPYGMKWDLEAVTVFKQLVDCKDVYACSEKSDVKANIHYLTLVDTNTEDDQNINELLIRMEMAREAPLEGDNSLANRYPTFKMIETGNCTPIVD